jgi:hypothetical protein
MRYISCGDLGKLSGNENIKLVDFLLSKCRSSFEFVQSKRSWKSSWSFILVSSVISKRQAASPTWHKHMERCRLSFYHIQIVWCFWQSENKSEWWTMCRTTAKSKFNTLNSDSPWQSSRYISLLSCLIVGLTENHNSWVFASETLDWEPIWLFKSFYFS